MSKSKKHPKVILLGRTNVGKSALFNRLSDNARSIVFDSTGVTRDYIHEVISWQGKSFDLVDSGGLPLGKQKDSILAAVQASVMELIEEAAAIIFVCDGKSGLLDDDRRISKILHKSGKPVLLAVNKADSEKDFEEHEHEFYALGYKKLFPVSAVHGLGIGDLLDELIPLIPDKVITKEGADHKVSIIGKPNVGKSSLMNILMREQRSIVSDVAGTTREAIAEKVKLPNFEISLVDTPGIRRKKKINEDLESIMVKSALKSVRDSDTVILMIDASEDKISDQELKLLFYAYENKKCILLIINKVDLIDIDHREMLEHQFKEYSFILDKISKVWTSCKDGKNIGKIVTSLQKTWERCSQELDEDALDDILQNQISRRPLYRNKIQLKVKSMRSIGSKIPTFVLRVNYPQFFGEDQLGFIENVLRKNYDLVGCPVRLLVRKK